jgi:hypothetical protein
MVEEYLDGPQEACSGSVVQRCRAEGPDAGRTAWIAGTTIGRAGTEAQQRADVLRIVLAALVSGAAGTDPRTRRVDRRAVAGQQRSARPARTADCMIAAANGGYNSRSGAVASTAPSPATSPR